MHKLQLAARGCARPRLAWLMHRRYFYTFALIFMQTLYNPKWVQMQENGCKPAKMGTKFLLIFFEKVLDNRHGIVYNLIRKKRKGNKKMKQLYRVERATEENYHRMMGGSMNYSIEKLDIEAETPEEAAKMAEAKGYMVNKKYVKTVAELDAEKAAWEAHLAVERAKEEAAKARKVAREAEKAEAMGLTVEEYKRYKKDKAIAKKLPAEIAGYEAEIERLKKGIARKRNYLEELNAKIEKIEKP